MTFNMLGSMLGRAASGRKLEQNKWLARYRLRPSSFKASFKASFKVAKPNAGA